MKKLIVTGSFVALALLVWWQTTGTPTEEPPAQLQEPAASPLTATLDRPGVQEGMDQSRVPVAADTVTAEVVPSAGDAMKPPVVERQPTRAMAAAKTVMRTLAEDLRFMDRFLLGASKLAGFTREST